MNNKRASIPVTVLVVLTIAVCIFALVSFFLASEKRTNELKGDDFLDALYLMKNNANMGYESPTSIKSKFDSVAIDGNKISLEKKDYNWAVGWWGILPYPKKDKFVLYRAQCPLTP